MDSSGPLCDHDKSREQLTKFAIKSRSHGLEAKGTERELHFPTTFFFAQSNYLKAAKLPSLTTSIACIYKAGAKIEGILGNNLSSFINSSPFHFVCIKSHFLRKPGK